MIIIMRFQTSRGIHCRAIEEIGSTSNKRNFILFWASGGGGGGGQGRVPTYHTSKGPPVALITLRYIYSFFFWGGEDWGGG